MKRHDLRWVLAVASVAAAVMFAPAYAGIDAQKATVSAAIQKTAVPELPAVAAGLVLQAKASERADMALAAVEVIVGKRQAVAVAVVAAIAKAAPEVAAQVAAKAVELSPKQAPAIARAAALAAPKHASQIAAAVAKAVPQNAQRVAFAVMTAVPAETVKVMESVIVAVPTVAPQVNLARRAINPGDVFQILQDWAGPLGYSVTAIQEGWLVEDPTAGWSMLVSMVSINGANYLDYTTPFDTSGNAVPGAAPNRPYARPN